MDCSANWTILLTLQIQLLIFFLFFFFWSNMSKCTSLHEYTVWWSCYDLGLEVMPKLNTTWVLSHSRFGSLGKPHGIIYWSCFHTYTVGLITILSIRAKYICVYIIIYTLLYMYILCMYISYMHVYIICVLCLYVYVNVVYMYFTYKISKIYINSKYHA